MSVVNRRLQYAGSIDTKCKLLQ